jgi:hypothetical protein
MKRTILALAAVLAAAAARADAGDEVDVTSGVVTGLRCALQARESGDLKGLSSCPPAEAAKGLVVYDVAESRIYEISRKKVARWQLESAYGGGSIDFTGVEVKVDPTTEVATVDVDEYSVRKKPKPGAFKGCL